MQTAVTGAALLRLCAGQVPAGIDSTEWRPDPEESLRTSWKEVGGALGVYRDFPESKGCISPFAPIWINEVVRRQS